jgi:hypothetical protein
LHFFPARPQPTSWCTSERVICPLRLKLSIEDCQLSPTPGSKNVKSMCTTPLSKHNAELVYRQSGADSLGLTNNGLSSTRLVTTLLFFPMISGTIHVSTPAAIVPDHLRLPLSYYLVCISWEATPLHTDLPPRLVLGVPVQRRWEHLELTWEPPLHKPHSIVDKTALKMQSSLTSSSFAVLPFSSRLSFSRLSMVTWLLVFSIMVTSSSGPASFFRSYFLGFPTPPHGTPTRCRVVGTQFSMGMYVLYTVPGFLCLLLPESGRRR